MKPDKKQISTALIEHMEREELHTGEAAKYLNLNPCYISMARSESSWGAMGSTAWARLEDWFNTRENIREFKIPEGEEIFIRKEKTPSVPKVKATGNRQPATGKDKETDEHSPVNLVPEEPKKEKQSKSVNLVINKAEIDTLRKLIDDNYKACNGVFDKFNDALNKMDIAYSEKFTELTMKLEVCEAKYNKLLDAFREHEIRLNNLQSLPSKGLKKPSKGIVIFQRNYYSK